MLQWPSHQKDRREEGNTEQEGEGGGANAGGAGDRREGEMTFSSLRCMASVNFPPLDTISVQALRWSSAAVLLGLSVSIVTPWS